MLTRPGARARDAGEGAGATRAHTREAGASACCGADDRCKTPLFFIVLVARPLADDVHLRARAQLLARLAASARVSEAGTFLRQFSVADAAARSERESIDASLSWPRDALLNAEKAAARARTAYELTRAFAEQTHGRECVALAEDAKNTSDGALRAQDAKWRAARESQRATEQQQEEE